MSLRVENRRYVNALRKAFDAEPHKSFGAICANGIVIVIAREGSPRGTDLIALVTEGWDGHFDMPTPRREKAKA